MSKLKKIFQKHRPEGFSGKGDNYLPSLYKELKKHIRKTYNKLNYNSLKLSNDFIEKLCWLLLEFYEDIHNDIGIWKSYEKYNREFFDVSLPMTIINQEDEKTSDFNKQRIKHFLWIIYTELIPELLFSSEHKDLEILSEAIFSFLEQKFIRVPRDSGVKKFLSEPDEYGWDVKRKLVWTGTHSYLFRSTFQNYSEKKSDLITIPLIDDFICQESTCWSGLGVIDILAGLLNITYSQRKELRSWYEKHFSIYNILEVKPDILRALNVINDEEYIVRVHINLNSFKVNDFVLGALTPWNKEWYWSGKQKIFMEIHREELDDLKKNFMKKSSQIIYRYSTKLRSDAVDITKIHYEYFVEYFGDELIVFPDGLTMAAEFQKKDRLFFEKSPEQKKQAYYKKCNHKKYSPRYNYPDDVLKEKNGLGIYFNQKYGTEIMTGFDYLISGCEKKGEGLNENEIEAIESFINEKVISPSFVKRIIRDYGDGSLKKVFFIKNDKNKYYIDYLLRRYKGNFYRNRYPYFSFYEEPV